MKKLLFILMVLALPVIVNGQDMYRMTDSNPGALYKESSRSQYSFYNEALPQVADTLDIRKNGIFYHGRITTTFQLCRIMKPNREASVKIQGAVALRVVSSIAAGVGGFCLGFSIGNKQMTKEQKNTFIWTGVGCLAVAFPVAFISDHMTKDAAHIYNRGLKTTSQLPHADIKLELAATGAGLKVRF